MLESFKQRSSTKDEEVILSRNSSTKNNYLLERVLKITKSSLTSKKLAVVIAQLAFDKKAEDIVVLDMRKVVNFCDYFVICSGTSDRHVKSIADGIDLGLEALGEAIPKFSRKAQETDWIVLDVGNVVAHIFQKDLRAFYNLEYLWQEAKVVNLDKDLL